MRILSWGGASVLAMAGMPALAGLEICNDTPDEQSVAIAHMVDEVWTSEGWWNIEPGDCAEPLSGDLKNQYYYYRAEVPGGSFEDEGYFFCTVDEAFTIPGQAKCEARGYGEHGFRRIDTGPTATHFTLTLVAPEDLEAEPPRKSPEPETSQSSSGLTRRSQIGPELWESGLAQGEWGEPFTQFAVFQGCDVFDGAAYCAFHADGWKWYAYYGGATPDAFLDRIRGLARGTNVELQGDIVNFGDISIEMTLSQISLRPGSNPFQKEFDALQGRWVSVDDPNYQIEVAGNEMYESYAGGSQETFFWRFDTTCDEAPPGVDYVLIKTAPETQDQTCFLPSFVSPSGWEMIYPGRGNTLAFRRP